MNFDDDDHKAVQVEFQPFTSSVLVLGTWLCSCDAPEKSEQARRRLSRSAQIPEQSQGYTSPDEHEQILRETF